MTLTATELEGALQQREAILDGHFKLSSGRHSQRFIQKFRILEDPRLVTEVAQSLLARFGSLAPTVVVSAAVGGIVLGYECARQLGVRGIFVEKEDGVPTLRRGFTLAATDRVLVVEDIVTTGLSVREILAVAGAAGAPVVGIGIIVRRAAIDFGAPTVALLDLPIESYAADACPLCAAGSVAVTPGSRFLV